MQSKTTTIYLFRHGETQWNLEQRFQGNQDSPLTHKGKRQVLKMAEKIKDIPFHAVYSSPLQRAQQTALMLTESHGLKPTPLPQLREICLGPWEGLTRSEAKSAYPQQYDYFWYQRDLFDLPGAEKFSVLQQRMIKVMEQIFSQHPGKSVMVVSHFISISSALDYYRKNKSLGSHEFQMANCSFVKMERTALHTELVLD